MLRRPQPGVEWEVHNAAMTAINSHVIVPIARECARLSPDVFVVLAGNNEAVGPYGPATVFGQAGLPMSLVNVANYVGATRAGQMLTRIPGRDQPREWRGLEMFTQQRLGVSDPRLERRYDAFRQNLAEIVRTGTRAGAEVLLATVPVNLRHCPPFASAGTNDAAQEFRGAVDLQRAGRVDEAAARFRRARGFDLLRFRADSRINDVIRDTAGRERARLVDTERSFGIAGSDMFREHVHFTPAGSLAQMQAARPRARAAHPVA